VRFYTQTGPHSAVEYGPFFVLCYWVGAFPFYVIALAFVVAVYAFAMVLMALLAINGIIYHKLTGKDARLWVPGSAQGTAIEYWMADKGWIRLPRHLQRPQLYR
jgi:hypothetical protein